MKSLNTELRKNHFTCSWRETRGKGLRRSCGLEQVCTVYTMLSIHCWETQSTVSLTDVTLLSSFICWWWGNFPIQQTFSFSFHGSSDLDHSGLIAFACLKGSVCFKQTSSCNALPNQPVCLFISVWKAEWRACSFCEFVAQMKYDVK